MDNLNRSVYCYKYVHYSSTTSDVSSSIVPSPHLPGYGTMYVSSCRLEEHLMSYQLLCIFYQYKMLERWFDFPIHLCTELRTVPRYTTVYNSK